MSKQSKVEKDIEAIISIIIEHTPILRNNFLFNTDVLDEQFSELAAKLNGKFKAIGSSSICGFDLLVVYRTTLDQQGAINLLGPKRKFSFGEGNEISNDGKSSSILF